MPASWPAGKLCSSDGFDLAVRRGWRVTTRCSKLHPFRTTIKASYQHYHARATGQYHSATGWFQRLAGGGFTDVGSAHQFHAAQRHPHPDHQLAGLFRIGCDHAQLCAHPCRSVRDQLLGHRLGGDGKHSRWDGCDDPDQSPDGPVPGRVSEQPAADCTPQQGGHRTEHLRLVVNQSGRAEFLRGQDGDFPRHGGPRFSDTKRQSPAAQAGWYREDSERYTVMSRGGPSG